MCNDLQVLEAISEPMRVVSVWSIDFDQVCPQKTLCVDWDPFSDNFMVSVQAVPGAMIQYGLLSMLSQIYDPLDMFVLILLVARHLVQVLFQKKTTLG